SAPAAAAEEEASQRQRACASLFSTDMGACTDAGRIHGSAQGARCRDSAQARYQQCAADATLGRLLTRPDFSP
ncbi:MAG: hypothetical protein H7Y16_02615, partial [Candidatus Parcubacteria bacterium]|nr:hypothetical protein [Burkholderiales bacterium]